MWQLWSSSCYYHLITLLLHPLQVDNQEHESNKQTATALHENFNHLKVLSIVKYYSLCLEVTDNQKEILPKNVRIYLFTIFSSFHVDLKSAYLLCDVYVCVTCDYFIRPIINSFVACTWLFINHLIRWVQDCNSGARVTSYWRLLSVVVHEPDSKCKFVEFICCSWYLFIALWK